MLKTAILKEKRELTHDVIELHFEAQQPFAYKAGQFITIKIDDQNPTPCFRAYSLSSPPSQDSRFEICLKVLPQGRGSSWLGKLEKGQKITFLGPNGNFILQPSSKKVLFIATGTGIGPFKAIVEDEFTHDSTQEMEIVFGLRHIKDIFYQELLENFAEHHPNFQYAITLSQPEDDSWKGPVGRVTTLLENKDIHPQNTEIYICGLKDMIDSVIQILTDKGVPKEIIHFEKYD